MDKTEETKDCQKIYQEAIKSLENVRRTLDTSNDGYIEDAIQRINEAIICIINAKE